MQHCRENQSAILKKHGSWMETDGSPRVLGPIGTQDEIVLLSVVFISGPKRV